MSQSLLLISDHSKEKLQEVPHKVMEMSNLKMLFLEGNILYKIPEDFFWKLPRLVWLDLRNNQLETLPKSIAHHNYLENLLLTNNNLRTLPNELGLVPKLKALQVSENPLIYPPKKVIVEGTKSIKTYLKQQYEKKMIALKNAQQQRREQEIRGQEELLTIEDLTTSDDSSSTKPKIFRDQAKNPANQIKSIIQKKSSETRAPRPILNVKRFTGVVPVAAERKESRKNVPVKIVHKISRTDRTISITSHLDKVGIINNMDKESSSSYREGWLNQLRILLSDQEKILQQERSLKALADWRKMRRPETPKVFYDEDPVTVSAPYATYPEFSKMPTREALANQLTAFLNDKRIPSAKKSQGVDLDKLINDLVHQLKEIEHTRGETRSPRSEVAAAEKQIKTISEIHRKLLHLKSQNLI